MPTNTFNTDMVLGFFDADGGIEAKVSIGTTKPVSFHVNVILSPAQQSCAGLRSKIATKKIGQSSKCV